MRSQPSALQVQPDQDLETLGGCAWMGEEPEAGFWVPSVWLKRQPCPDPNPSQAAGSVQGSKPRLPIATTQLS